MSFVLDASVTVAWFMPDETASKELLERAAEDGAVVPMIWPVEVGNSLLAAVRRRRVSLQHRADALNQLAALAISRDSETLAQAWSSTLTLADRFGLTLYDACYLELAQRRGLALATLDRDLRTAGQSLGVELLGI